MVSAAVRPGGKTHAGGAPFRSVVGDRYEEDRIRCFITDYYGHFNLVCPVDGRPIYFYGRNYAFGEGPPDFSSNEFGGRSRILRPRFLLRQLITNLIGGKLIFTDKLLPAQLLQQGFQQTQLFLQQTFVIQQQTEFLQFLQYAGILIDAFIVNAIVYIYFRKF